MRGNPGALHRRSLCFGKIILDRVSGGRPRDRGKASVLGRDVTGALYCGLWLKSLKSLIWGLLRSVSWGSDQREDSQCRTGPGGRTPVREPESFTAAWDGGGGGVFWVVPHPGAQGKAAPRCLCG